MTHDITSQASSNVKAPQSQRDYLLLDASGSMHSKWQDCLQSVDNYVAQLRDNSVNSVITVASFTSTGMYESDTIDYQIMRDANPQTWTDTQYDNDIVMGGRTTPLYDAINVMMLDLREAMPQKCSILIFTDGDENASKTTVVQARALLDWARALGWQVTFVGCDFENSRQAKLLGANEENSIGVSIKRLVDATSVLAEKRANYGLYGTDINLTKDEKTELGGLLPDHTAK